MTFEYLGGVLIVVGLMAVVWSKFEEEKRKKEEVEEEKSELDEVKVSK